MNGSSETTERMFFYGTLRDPEGLSALTGRGLETLAPQPAEIAGWRAAALDGGLYPGLSPAPEARLPGVVVSGLGPWARARLDAYEGPAYHVIRVDAACEGETIPAEVFAPVAAEEPPSWAPNWVFELWREAHGASFRDAAARLGALFDKIEAAAGGGAPTPQARAALAEAAGLWPDLFGAARFRRGEPGPVARAGGLAYGRDDARVIERERPYDAYFKVDRCVVSHRRLMATASAEEGDAAEGRWSAPIEFSVFRSGPAISVLPYDPHLDQVLLIEQFRAGLYAAEDFQPWSIEAIAGRIDRGEIGTPDAAEHAARREAEEEAGLSLGRLERIMLTYASPGAVDESLVHFVGEADLSGRAAASLHGLPEEGEDIRAFTLPLEEALTALAAEEIRNAPAALSLLWLARHRPRLQRLWRD